jgi:hypothetical protein
MCGKGGLAGKRVGQDRVRGREPLSLEDPATMHKSARGRVIPRCQLYERLRNRDEQQRNQAGPSIAKNSTIITPIPSPLSALHSMSIRPEIWPPAAKTASETFNETLTFGWCGDAFMGSGRVCAMMDG